MKEFRGHTNQKGRSSMISFCPESRVETAEQCEEQISAIACAYSTNALLRRTESWKLSVEFRLQSITGVTTQHPRDLDAAVGQSRRAHGCGGSGSPLLVQDRLAIICNFLTGNNAGEFDVGGCVSGPVAV